MWKMKFQFSHFFKKFNFLKSAKKVWKKGGTSFSLFFKGSWSLTPHLAVIRANLDKCLFLSLNAITARSRKWRYYSPRTACFSLGALQEGWGSRGVRKSTPRPGPQKSRPRTGFWEVPKGPDQGHVNQAYKTLVFFTCQDQDLKDWL